MKRLLFAQVGGCNCDLKTPDISYHDPQCHYRLFVEARDEIARLEKDISKAQRRSGGGVIDGN